MQKGLSLSFQCTCHNGESAGALARVNHESQCQSLKNGWAAFARFAPFSWSWNHDQHLETFPDSANSGRKKGRFESLLQWPSFSFMFDFWAGRNRVTVQHGSFYFVLDQIFSGSVWKKHPERETRNHVSARIQYIEFMCKYIHVYLYINLMNNVAVSFRSFHHQAVFSLNKILVYGGIRCHSFEKRWKHYCSEKNVRYHK